MKSEKKNIIIFIVCAVAVVVGLVCYGIYKNNLAEQEYIKAEHITKEYDQETQKELQQENKKLLQSGPHAVTNLK